MNEITSCNGCTACCLKMLHQGIPAREAVILTGGEHMFTRNRQQLKTAFQDNLDVSVVYKNVMTDPTINDPLAKVDVYVPDCKKRVPGVGCSDYSNRPISCRKLSVGSHGCHCAINDNL